MQHLTDFKSMLLTNKDTTIFENVMKANNWEHVCSVITGEEGGSIWMLEAENIMSNAIYVYLTNQGYERFFERKGSTGSHYYTVKFNSLMVSDIILESLWDKDGKAL